MSEPRDEFERHFAERYAHYLEEEVGKMHPGGVAAGMTADEPRGPGWLRMAMVGSATIAAAVIVTFVALGVLPRTSGPVGISSESPRVSVAPSATLAPTPAATPSQSVAVPWPTVARSEASVPSSLEGEGFAFWTLFRPPPCCGSKLRISTSTGSSDRVIDVPDFVASSEFWPTPAGPAGGLLLYVVDDGRTAHLRVADAWTGADNELLSTSQMIGRLAIDRDGSTAYYLLFDRRTSAFGGLWGVPTGGGEPRPLASVQATAALATLAATRVYISPQLAVSEDGSWIAYVICHTIDCDFHAIHSDGTAEPLDWSNFHAGDEIIGIAGNMLIGSAECPQTTCDGFVLDLRTGERWPLGGGGSPFAPEAMIAGPHGPLVLGERAEYEQGLWRVEAVDLTNGSRSMVFEAAFQPNVSEVHLAVGYQLDRPAGAELPPGWFLIYRITDVTTLSLPFDYSAATDGATVEEELPFMRLSHP